MPITLLCKVCSEEFNVKPYKKNTALYCSYKCRNLDFKERFKGNKNPFYGKTHTDFVKELITHRNRGNKYRLGKKLSSEVKKKISETLKKNPTKFWLGKVRSEETKRKISLSKKGKPGVWLGKKRPPFSEDWINKMSEAVHQRHQEENFGFAKGEDNFSWAGGIASKGYGEEWTVRLKRIIKKRDGYICQLCKTQNNLAVHHIDYNKKNCGLSNLITLCVSCNVKVNFKRAYWENYFINYGSK
jgi:hypothetical protein